MKFLKKNLVFLLVAIAACEAVGIIGAVFTAPAIPAWYAGLMKPVFSPPNWLFGPVWTALYALMGLSLTVIWSNRSVKRKSNRKEGIILFILQLGFNTLWSFIFFGLRNPALAFVEILVLWTVIAATIASFYRVSRSAAYLLVPYMAWVTFAGYLNAAVWILN